MGCVCTQNPAKSSDLITGAKEKGSENMSQAKESGITPVESKSIINNNDCEFKDEKSNKESIDLNNKNPNPSTYSMKESFLRSGDTASMLEDNKTDISNNRVPKKKKKFDIEIFEIINNFRTNPKSFSEKILNLQSEIKTLKDKIVFSRKGIAKIVMNRGVEALISVAKLISEMEPMPKLEYSKKVEIEVPEMENWLKYSELVDKKTEELKNNSKYKFNSFSFHFDLSINDPELSFLMQIVDDNSFNGVRRSHFCDPLMKYIGITYSQVTIIPDSGIGLEEKKKEKRFCAYFSFAK